MALILTRDLEGRGNCDADGTYMPLKKVERDGRTLQVRTGGEALRLATAKAEGMVFLPWRPIHCGSRRQEDAILRHCARSFGTDSPIVRIDLENKVLVKAYKDHNPTDPKVLALNAAIATGDPEEIVSAALDFTRSLQVAPSLNARTVPLYQNIDTAPRRLVEHSTSTQAPAGPSERAAMRKRGAEAAAEIDQRRGEYADGVAQARYEECVAQGMDEQAAKMQAGKAKAAAMRRGGEGIEAAAA